ncbi:metal-dependent hydrolase [Erythrobacter oryzae]|uniref:metal-dependent hydrolase n=1 Tax=Erythrobacter oryzae TaxID=3019556 RepID=UPI002556C346|nr:metal-dependent hydrolase [Erythrobacter sp. COR-2]
MEEMTIRRMEFAFRPDMDLVFVKDDPEMSFMFLGAWMMLPYLEPFLIRTMRDALPLIRDPQIKEDLKRFCAQEGEHYKQHARANELIRALHPSYEALLPLEKELDAELKAFTRDKPLKFKLAYAEGFESMTSAMSRAQFEVGLYDRTDSPLADLAKWHVMEELEHRTVAFDVYEHIVGSWFYRMKQSLWSQKHYMGWVKRFQAVLVAPQGELFAAYNTPEIAARRKAFNSHYLKRGIPRVLATYMPWYNPAKVDLPEQFQTAREHYSRTALTTA